MCLWDTLTVSNIALSAISSISVLLPSNMLSGLNFPWMVDPVGIWGANTGAEGLCSWDTLPASTVVTSIKSSPF